MEFLPVDFSGSIMTWTLVFIGWLDILADSFDSSCTYWPPAKEIL
jgi:hypothetical protein